MTTDSMSTIRPHSYVSFNIEKISYNAELDYHSNKSVNSYMLDKNIPNREVSAAVSYTVGCLMTAVFILGICENGTVLFVYSRSQKVRTSNMAFVIGLSISDTGQTVFNIPFVIFACFSRKWIFGHAGCAYIGFVTTWFGVTQISILCVIALERYFIIVGRAPKFGKSSIRTKTTIATCFIYGAIWALCPVLGWSKYKLVAGQISCSLDWSPDNNVNLSYTLSLLSVVWFLPLTLITFAYVKIAKLLYNQKERRMSLGGKTKTKRERRVAITMLIMIGAFVLSWTPYSVVALMSIFGDMDNAPSGVYLAPAAFAKASIIWNPIIYIARHQEFRRACVKSYRKFLAELHVYDNTNISTSNNGPSPDASSKRHVVLPKRKGSRQNSNCYLSLQERPSVSSLTIDDNVSLSALRQRRASSTTSDIQNYTPIDEEDCPGQELRTVSIRSEMQKHVRDMSDPTIKLLLNHRTGFQSKCSKSALTEIPIDLQRTGGEYNSIGCSGKRQCVIKMKYCKNNYEQGNTKDGATFIRDRIASNTNERQQVTQLETQTTKLETTAKNVLNYKKKDYSGKQNDTFHVASNGQKEALNCLQLSPQCTHSRELRYKQSLEQPFTKYYSRLKNKHTGRFYKCLHKPTNSSETKACEMKEMSRLNQKYLWVQRQTNDNTLRKHSKEELISMHTFNRCHVEHGKVLYDSNFYLNLDYDAHGRLIRQSVV